MKPETVLKIKEHNVLRSKRKRFVRSSTLRRIPQRDIAINRALDAEFEELFGPLPERPKTRGDCVGAERPCPFAACRYHLYLDFMPSGSIKLNFPDLEVWEMPETCALDVADRGGETLEVTGELMNLTRERVRQIENQAFNKLKRRLPFLRIL